MNTTELRQFYVTVRAHSMKRLQNIDLVKMLLAEYHIAVYKTI